MLQYNVTVDGEFSSVFVTKRILSLTRFTKERIVGNIVNSRITGC